MKAEGDGTEAEGDDTDDGEEFSFWNVMEVSVFQRRGLLGSTITDQLQIQERWILSISAALRVADQVVQGLLAARTMTDQLPTTSTLPAHTSS
jgi:hypothetical protein